MIFGAPMILNRQDAAADRGFLRGVIGFDCIDGGDAGLYQPQHPLAPGLRPAQPTADSSD